MKETHLMLQSLVLHKVRVDGYLKKLNTECKVLEAFEATCCWSHSISTCVRLFSCLSKAQQHKSNKEMCVLSVLNLNEAQMRTDRGGGD